MRTSKLVKDLTGLEIKLDEIDKLLNKARVVVNEISWDIRISTEKRKKDT